MEEVIETTNQEDGVPKEPTPSISVLRAQIINSVLEHGLKPAGQLKEEGKFHLPSKDSSAFTEVEGCVIKPSVGYPDSASRDTDLEKVLYADELSILPVMMERRIDFMGLDNFYDQLSNYYKKYSRMTAHEKAAGEERMDASFLVVYRASSLPNLIEGSGMVDAYGVEETGLTPNATAYLVFPTGIYEEYQKSGVAKKDLFIPVKVTNRSIKKRLMWIKYNTFKVPDYEQPLKEIADEIGEPIWIHGVRLPTHEDIDHLKS